MEQKGMVLIADDEERIRRMVRDYLGGCGYEVYESRNGREAMETFTAMNSRIDVILLDVMMPEMDGFSFLKEVRAISDVPVIMLTARTADRDQVDCLKQGADDFITKPFSLSVLEAHIESVLKRCNRIRQEELAAGTLRIREKEMLVLQDGEVLELTPKEYDLLLFLVKNPRMVHTREQILNQIWNFDYDGDLRTVDTHIKQLRAKLSEENQFIHTVHGKGYRFECQ